ncbi:carboxypeptidase regulatory-like domain-containing protein [uncultured Caulobacter sp.]|uniref:TonB-dependent receptor n=1 Tax=uncultured Caulobacter sp. TaxID=158749 RepID=UPI0026217DCF|nr:carboxypeptidase regulatory-like domain-containing protein [uncultured Caulobacter sp.]
MSIKRLAAGAALGVMAVAMAGAVYAQETTASLHGQVTNNGAAVANASVTVVHKPSGTRSTTVTGASGAFDARGLRVGGPYTVTVTAPGGGSKIFNDLFLSLGKTTDLGVELGDSAEVESIVVSAASRANNDQGPKTVLNRDDLNSVVAVTRDPRDFARRDILVAQDLSGGRAGTNAGGISIAGSNPRLNRLTVDGVSAQDNFGLAQGGMSTARGPVTLDAVEQFAVAAVPTDVENGDFVGGALNLVLRSGGNSFHGVLFDNYLNEGMVGRHYSDTRVPQTISQKNYGGFLSGPIIKDKLFFAVSYENYKTLDTTQFGAPGSGAVNIFTNNLTQATIDSIVNTYNTGYASKYSLGGIPLTAPVTDKKYSAKIDWNISDKHRASLTYRYAESSSLQRTDLGAGVAALYSHWYKQENSDEATTLEIHSNWTDKLATTLKATYRDYRNGQNPPGGQNFSDVRVCTAPSSDATLTSCAAGFSQVYFGPDQFRHANALDEQETRYQAVAEYSWRENRFKIGAQARKADVFDVFVPNSRGQYYFDSLADYQAGKASQLIYANSVTGKANDAAFNSTYWTYSGFAQDTLDVTDNLQVTAGVRFDWYDQPDRPILNPNFTARNGFSNQKTIDGLYVFMPRLSVDWKATDSLRFTGGFGLFAGGSPDVLTGISFYNTGYATSQVTIQRTASGTFTETGGTPGFTQAIGAAALNNLNTDSNFGLAVPQVVQQLQQGTLTGSVTIPPLSEAIALSPSFEMPGQWKLYLSGEWRGSGKWTEGVTATANFIATQSKNELTYYDSRAQPLIIDGKQQFLPDGRIRYDGLAATTLGKGSTNLGSNRDVIVTNTDKGESWTASFQVGKRFDWGGDVSLGYARQHMNDVNAGLFFGTTAGSLYGGVAAGMDPNRDYLGRSVYEIKNRFKAEFSYRKKFFGDNETRVTLFAERQDGRPFGFYMQDRQSGRSPVFGVNRTAQMLYVPDMSGNGGATGLDYGLVTFATPNDAALFKKYVTQFNLPTGLIEKNSNTNAPVNRLDAQFSQELPTLINGHKLKVQVDVRNLLNLINRDWGLVSEYGDINTLARVDCLKEGNALATSSDSPCLRYRYSSVPTSVTKTRNTGLSLWYMQVSLRYEF